MNKENPPTDSERFTLLLCSFRYALGRRSYMVSTIADMMLDNEDFLLAYKDQIVDDIERSISMGDIGDSCDKSVWLKVVDKINEIK
jgi:hypothetical protein